MHISENQYNWCHDEIDPDGEVGKKVDRIGERVVSSDDTNWQSLCLSLCHYVLFFVNLLLFVTFAEFGRSAQAKVCIQLILPLLLEVADHTPGLNSNAYFVPKLKRSFSLLLCRLRLFLPRPSEWLFSLMLIHFRRLAAFNFFNFLFVKSEFHLSKR